MDNVVLQLFTDNDLVDPKAYKEAIKLMPDIEKQKSFRIAPNYINVYYNLANLIKLDSNRLEEAIKVRFCIAMLFCYRYLCSGFFPNT